MLQFSENKKPRKREAKATTKQTIQLAEDSVSESESDHNQMQVK